MSAGVKLTIQGGDVLAGRLSRLRADIDDHVGINTAIASTLVHGGSFRGRTLRGVSEHITLAATSRHKTADRFGATRTGYLEQAAQSIQINATADSAGFTIVNSAEIFSRTFGTVQVTIDKRKWLTMPADARGYGKSPLNFPGQLDFIELKPGVLACWVMRKTPKADGVIKTTKADKPEKVKRPAKTTEIEEKLDVVFWGRKKTLLPKDRGLLPTDDEIYNLVGLGIDQVLDQALNGEALP